MLSEFWIQPRIYPVYPFDMPDLQLYRMPQSCPKQRLEGYIIPLSSVLGPIPQGLAEESSKGFRKKWMVWDREDGRTTGWNPIGRSMSIRSWRAATPKDFSCQWIPRQTYALRLSGC